MDGLEVGPTERRVTWGAHGSCSPHSSNGENLGQPQQALSRVYRRPFGGDGPETLPARRLGKDRYRASRRKRDGVDPPDESLDRLHAPGQGLSLAESQLVEDGARMSLYLLIVQV